MKKFNSLLIALFIIVLINGCDNSNRKSISGKYSYTVLVDKSGKAADEYEYILISIIAKDKKDSIWLRKMAPFTGWGIEKRSATINSGLIDEIFYESSPGDSLTFQLTVPQFFKYAAQSAMPPHVDTTLILDVHARVDTILTINAFDEFNKNKKERLIQRNINKLKRRAREQSKEIAKVLEKKGIETTVSENGVHIYIDQDSDGPLLKTMDRVKLNYTGYILSDSTVFDTSIREVAQKNDVVVPGRNYKPYEFVIDKTGVVRGWHEGFKYLKEGMVATLIIPSPLGYGTRWAARGKVPPDMPLIYEIEVLEIIGNEGL